jgi:DNA excision repair protein ERCC-3
MIQEDISEIKKAVDSSLEKMDNLIESIKQERENIKVELESKIEQISIGKFNKEEIDDFLKEPYVIIPKRENEFYVIAPKWIDFQIGWLERMTKTYNIFVVNRYMQWIAPVPEVLKQKLKFPTPLPLKVIDGVLLTGKEHQEEAWRLYGNFLKQREGEDRIKIRRGSEFQLIAKMIEDGILPFMPNKVQEEDLTDWAGIELRQYQTDAWNEFLDKGACGIFWSFSAGKSLFGIYALARLKGRHLVVVPTLTLKEQWEERIEKFIPEKRNDIELVTYHAYDKVRNNEYVLIIFDECSHLPANTFIRLSTVRTKYRLGFSGSPFREDKRENYIFALTGFPVGMSWDELIKMKVIKLPIFRLFLLSNNFEKLRKLDELLKLPVKTLIFCDSIDFGQKIANKFDIPFVYGETKGRMDIIRESNTTVISRVGDEGISLPEIERTIEVSFLFGSRSQESQRFGRVMHSQKEEPEHNILMTEEEFEKYGKRLNSIYERGGRIEIIR